MNLNTDVWHVIASEEKDGRRKELAFVCSVKTPAAFQYNVTCVGISGSCGGFGSFEAALQHYEECEL